MRERHYPKEVKKALQQYINSRSNNVVYCALGYKKRLNQRVYPEQLCIRIYVRNKGKFPFDPIPGFFLGIPTDVVDWNTPC